MINYNIHLIRHGFTEETIQGIYEGQAPKSPLAPESIEGLQLLQSEFSYPPVQKVFLSPNRRCRETCQQLYPQSYAVELPQFQEINLGDFEGRSMTDLEKDPLFLRWMGDTKHQTPPNGESDQAFKHRIFQGFSALVADVIKNKCTSTALITHGSVIMNLLSQYGLPKQPPFFWMVGSGKGVTLQVSTLLWSHDGTFEIAGIVPYGLADFK